MHHSVVGPSFDVLTDALPNDHSLPAFMVSTSRGFLPREDPIVQLPSDFESLESLLTRMPIKTSSGAPGLLACCTLGEAVTKDLPDLIKVIEKYQKDLPLMNALYRDYAFLASAYLLEPCHERFMRGEPYGLGRQTLPKNIAVPLAKVAEIAGFKPFMEYAGSYALYNYRLEEPSQGMAYSNLRLIRAFEHGLDPTSSEAGFVLVHVDMVKHSAELVTGAVEALDACANDKRETFDEGLRKLIDALVKVNRVMDGMWNKSKPREYTGFRTFIFGITGQSMFPNGVVYEGVSEEPVSFRGESGANDSMIPLCDNLMQITMPSTPLTDILKDFRSYRPGNHREFLEWVKYRSDALGFKAYAMQDATSCALYIHALNQVRDFRWRHWCFTREYILKQTAHPTATGGSPIVTWLPNQLLAVLDQLTEVASNAPVETRGLRGIKEIVELAEHQKGSLSKEVEKWCKEREG